MIRRALNASRSGARSRRARRARRPGRPCGQVGAQGIASSASSNACCSRGSSTSPLRRALWQARVANRRSAASRLRAPARSASAAAPAAASSSARSAHQHRRVALGQQRRHCAHRHRVLAEGLELEAEAAQRLGGVGQRRSGCGLERDRQRSQQALALDALARASRRAAARRARARARRAGRPGAGGPWSRAPGRWRETARAAAGRRSARAARRRAPPSRQPDRGAPPRLAASARCAPAKIQSPCRAPPGAAARRRSGRRHPGARCRRRRRASRRRVSRSSGARRRRRARRGAPGGGSTGGRRSAPPTSPGARSRRPRPAATSGRATPWESDRAAACRGRPRPARAGAVGRAPAGRSRRGGCPAMVGRCRSGRDTKPCRAAGPSSRSAGSSAAASCSPSTAATRSSSVPRRRPDERRPVVAPDLEVDVAEAPAPTRASQSAMCPHSVLTVLRNLRRAGTLAKRSATSTRVPSGRPDRPLVAIRPASTRSSKASGASAGPRAQPQTRDRGDRRERLAAEAVGQDPLEVVARGDLAGGVALERQASVLGRHAAAVVGDRDPVPAAVPHLDPQPARPGVEGVLDQLLHHGGRPLHDLSGRDLVDQGVGQRPDAPRSAFGFRLLAGHGTPRPGPVPRRGARRASSGAPAGRV